MDNLEVNWSHIRELHPKYPAPFKDKNGVEHKNVMEAFMSVVGNKAINIPLAIGLLIKIVVSQAVQVAKIRAIFQSSINTFFLFNQEDPEFLPRGDITNTWGRVTKDDKVIGKNLYGLVLRKARDQIVLNMKRAEFDESTGGVPGGCQPCVKCGGHGDVAGTGYFKAVANNDGDWKYIGPCFDCMPRNSTEPRGLGYITRSKARSNWIYNQTNPGKFAEDNLHNPDDVSLWRGACSMCGIKAGEGVVIFVGRNGEPTVCKKCFVEHKAKDMVDNMKVEASPSVEMPL